MPSTLTQGRRAPRRVGAHGLLVTDTEREARVGAAAWVDQQLACGAKVYYKGWVDDDRDPREHWLAGSAGATRAIESGQLEILGFDEVIRRCGGTTEGLHALLRDEVERAVGPQGWGRVAMSQESAQRPMADEAQAAEFAVQESAYDELARRWPLTTLCQLTVAQESSAAAWESAALHHEQIVDPQWSTSASPSPRRWAVRGTLDAHVVERFGAALYGALRAARDAPAGPDLHVDLAGVDFVDLAVVQTLFVTAHSAAGRQRVVLHGCPRFVRRVLEVAGPPAAVVLAPDGAP